MKRIGIHEVKSMQIIEQPRNDKNTGDEQVYLRRNWKIQKRHNRVTELEES